MKRLTSMVFLAALTVAGAVAQDQPAGGPKLPAGQDQAAYDKTIETRVDDIVKPLQIADTAKAARVHDIIVDQYHALKQWHGDNDAKLKMAARDTNAVAEIRASLKVIHDRFLAKLSAELTPEQVDLVKDKMVYNKVQVTYTAYCTIIPVLTDAQKAYILSVLKEAREEAMDGGSVNEKSAIFKKYKGRIANYLSKQGINEAKFRKEWTAKNQSENAASAVPQN